MNDRHMNDIGDRVERYARLVPSVRELVKEERDLIATMANIAAAIHAEFGWHWTGFYRVLGTELVLGPFQGPVACTRIGYGMGVCGTAWKEERVVIVPDVDRFPGHIACSTGSRSEIVVPVFDNDGRVAAVLDIDSAQLNDFSVADEQALKLVAELLQPLFDQ
jgi:L-methionine (R)-S-oxide reductase